MRLAVVVFSSLADQGRDEIREMADNNSNTNDKQGDVKLFYRNQMTDTYKIAEKEIQKIVHQDVVPTHPNSDLKLFIYYKNKKLKSLFIKNNTNRSTEIFNVVYRYQCDEVHMYNAQNTYYIGHTTTTIKERIKQHTSIKKHHRDHHNCNITGSQILPNVSVLAKLNNKVDLVIMEALLIKQEQPLINIQTDDFNRTLKIF